MPLRYKQAQLLEHEHKDTITALAFSPNGSFLAIASLDGKLSVWSATSWKAIYVVATGGVGFLSIIWTSSTEDHLLCGLANGVVVSVQITKQDVTVTGFRGHFDLPVECIAISDTIVATGANSEVSLWSHDKGNWAKLGDIGPPPSIATNRDSDITVTALCWARTKYSDRTLLIAYLHHGVVFWDALKSRMAHFFYVKTLVGSMSISPNGNVLVVSNLDSGFDFYHLDDSGQDGSVSHPCTGLRVPVEFIHCGNAVLGGSTSGEVHVWDCVTRARLQVLHHVDRRPVISIASHYGSGKDAPIFMLATGTLAERENKPRVIVWRPVAEGDEPVKLVEKKLGPQGWNNFTATVIQVLCVVSVTILAYVAGSMFGLPVTQITGK